MYCYWNENVRLLFHQSFVTTLCSSPSCILMIACYAFKVQLHVLHFATPCFRTNHKHLFNEQLFLKGFCLAGVGSGTTGLSGAGTGGDYGTTVTGTGGGLGTGGDYGTTGTGTRTGTGYGTGGDYGTTGTGTHTGTGYGTGGDYGTTGTTGREYDSTAVGTERTTGEAEGKPPFTLL
jgi:hypothetical protein